MANRPDLSPPADVCLLLRAHAEARWLGREMVPVLRELERQAHATEQLAAARAYLEVLWMEASSRARETDTARIVLDSAGPGENRGLHSNARRYHAAVRRLRRSISLRVERFIVASGASRADHATS
jgi:hypothetical protein